MKPLSLQHLTAIAALYVQDTNTHRANALAAMERFTATGRGMNYAASYARLCRESHAKALAALEAVAKAPPA
jgi:hypothetical protein